MIRCTVRANGALKLDLRAMEELRRLAPSDNHKAAARKRDHQGAEYVAADAFEQLHRHNRDQRHAGKARQQPQLHREQSPYMGLCVRIVQRRCMKNVIVFAVHLGLPI